MLLVYAAALLALLMLGSRLRIKSQGFYLTIGTVIWFLFLNSGIHPTIAGVLVAFCIPAKPVFAPKKYVQQIRTAISHFRGQDDEQLSRRSILDCDQMNWLKEVESASDKVISPLQELEDTLHPLVNYFILPLFAFANAGIFLLDMDPASVVESVSLAVILALMLGKFLGIFLFSWATVKLKWAPLPAHCNWHEMASVAMLGGIGFTVSLFIATLSFGASPEQAAELAARLRGMQCHVNLIPLNSVPERGLCGVSEREVEAFKQALERRHISVTRRREMGDDIEGACGQLRRRYLGQQTRADAAGQAEE